MILDGICYPVIHFGRVILYAWSSPFVVSLFLASTLLYLRVLSSPDVYRRLCVSPHAALLIIRPSCHLLKTLSPFLWRGCINPPPPPLLLHCLTTMRGAKLFSRRPSKMRQSKVQGLSLEYKLSLESSATVCTLCGGAMKVLFGWNCERITDRGPM